ncbi:alpha-L-arabinofuranosidase C-terminal domain-containing protein, partial [Arthrobacter sp. ISL-28]|uniref:alpha-L-arabinofuranosidase C-terminal domain-containing protein n=1 Tax=Arthrobacter sp. ISL-28 TaxID=2819108 RepID=UPI001C162E84
DAVATFDLDAATTSVFLVNRSRTDEATVTIDLTALNSVIVLDAQTLSDTDVYAKNTLEDPDRVGLHPNKSAVVRNGVVEITLPPVSWTALNIG